MNRIRYLDGLRGLLALIVFLHHYLYAFAPNVLFGGDYQRFISTGPFTFSKLLALTPVNIIFNPGSAIMFFFLLSGFVQTYNYFQKPELHFLQRSFLKRYFRLAVPTLTTVLLVFLFHRLGLFHKELIPENGLSTEWKKSLIPDNLGPGKAIWYGLFGVFEGSARYYQVLWTMSRELFSSWVVLVTLMLTHKTSLRLPLSVAWLMVQLVVLQSPNAAAFTVGLILCELWTNSRKFAGLLSGSMANFICFAAGLYLAGIPTTLYQNGLQRSIYAPFSDAPNLLVLVSYLGGVTLLFCWLLYSEGVQKVLQSRPLLFLGDLSFMVYLVHLMLLLSFSPLVYQQLSHIIQGPALIFVTGVFSFFITLLVSYLLFRFVDRPTLQKSNQLIGKVMRDPSQQKTPR